METLHLLERLKGILALQNITCLIVLSSAVRFLCWDAGMEQCSLCFTQRREFGYALASATQGRSVPSDE